jgi:DNA processing protein
LHSDLLYRVALSYIPNIGDVHTKTLVNIYGSALGIFKARKKELEQIEGIGSIRASAITSFDNFSAPEKELAFINKYKITPLFITDDNYPKRLLNCFDSPVMLYYKGNADLNTGKIIGIVGTRTNDDYGKTTCEKIINALAEHNVMVVSGLAFGIDSIAHKASLKNDLKTVGVLAHGLDRIYPSQNKSLAKDMVENGGLLTDFKSGSKPDKQNFPKRNRIVAGMCDAVLVIQTGIKGGSLITAELGNSYNKDVFAVPGRIGDTKSEGCNYLIKNNKAALITCAEDVIENMSWAEIKKITAKKQKELFIELTNNEKIIFNILNPSGQLHIDEIFLKSNLNSSSVAEALLTLEMQNIIASLPGKIYKVID